MPIFCVRGWGNVPTVWNHYNTVIIVYVLGIQPLDCESYSELCRIEIKSGWQLLIDSRRDQREPKHAGRLLTINTVSGATLDSLVCLQPLTSLLSMKFTTLKFLCCVLLCLQSEISLYPYEQRWMPLQIFVRDEAYLPPLVSPAAIRCLNVLRVCFRSTETTKEMLNKLHLTVADIVECSGLDEIREKVGTWRIYFRNCTDAFTVISRIVPLKNSKPPYLCWKMWTGRENEKWSNL